MLEHLNMLGFSLCNFAFLSPHTLHNNLMDMAWMQMTAEPWQHLKKYV